MESTNACCVTLFCVVPFCLFPAFLQPFCAVVPTGSGKPGNLREDFQSGKMVILADFWNKSGKIWYFWEKFSYWRWKSVLFGSFPKFLTLYKSSKKFLLLPVKLSGKRSNFSGKSREIFFRDKSGNPAQSFLSCIHSSTSFKRRGFCSVLFLDQTAGFGAKKRSSLFHWYQARDIEVDDRRSLCAQKKEDIPYKMGKILTSFRNLNSRLTKNPQLVPDGFLFFPR